MNLEFTSTTIRIKFFYLHLTFPVNIGRYRDIWYDKPYIRGKLIGFGTTVKFNAFIQRPAVFVEYKKNK